MNWQQHKYPIELELDFAEYIQYTDVRIADVCLALLYHLLGRIISATVDLVYVNLQPEYEPPSSTPFG